jgi:hypothetical protein
MYEMSDLYELAGRPTTAPGRQEQDMGRVRRTLVAVLAAAFLVGGAGTALAAPPAPAALPAPAAPAPAVVDPDTGCETGADGYAPPGRCELVIVRAAGICLEAAPVLDYAVEAYGTTDDTVTITWVNPGGEDIVQSGLPLTGRVYWPGTVIQNGVVVDWPGWMLSPEGTWTEHDAYDFTRPEVEVVLSVNPEASTVVSYPPETSLCANPPMSQVLAASDTTTTSRVLAAPDSAVLAVTGADSWPLLAGAGMLVLLGAALVTTSVRRHHSRG